MRITNSVVIDKQVLKSTLLSLERDVIARAEAAYQTFVQGARYDADQTVEDDDIAQAITQRNLADEAETHLHAHEQHAKQIEAIDFGSKTEVGPGAVVKLAGTKRYLVVAVATSEFDCDGRPYLGISTDAPLYEAMAGLVAGDTFDVGDRERTIELVA